MVVGWWQPWWKWWWQGLRLVVEYSQDGSGYDSWPKEGSIFTPGFQLCSSPRWILPFFPQLSEFHCSATPYKKCSPEFQTDLQLLELSLKLPEARNLVQKGRWLGCATLTQFSAYSNAPNHLTVLSGTVYSGSICQSHMLWSHFPVEVEFLLSQNASKVCFVCMTTWNGKARTKSSQTDYSYGDCEYRIW